MESRLDKPDYSQEGTKPPNSSNDLSAQTMGPQQVAPLSATGIPHSQSSPGP